MLFFVTQVIWPYRTIKSWVYIAPVYILNEYKISFGDAILYILYFHHKSTMELI